MESKEQIRKRMKQYRKEMSVPEREAAGKKIRDLFLALPEYQNCRMVFAYLSHAGEIPTQGLVAEILNSGRKVAVPKVIGNGNMEFFGIRSLEECAPGAYGILEPRTEAILSPDPAALPAMLLPGLAFTADGERLGYGGGYYDRYLKRHPGIFKIAFAYGFSLLPKLPADMHDEKADMVVLPGRVIRVLPGS